MKKIPIIIITGFLGCGKTTLLREMIQSKSSLMRIAVVQNEFAQSGIDGEILRDIDSKFELRELNTGSIFCACLFSKFKDVIQDIATIISPDVIIVETTGIADPIAAAQLLESPPVSDLAYISRIVTVVDAPRFSLALSKLPSVRHQIQVADLVLINKCDLSNEEQLSQTEKDVAAINPLAIRACGTHGKFDMEQIFANDESHIMHSDSPRGELTRCGEVEFISKSFRSARPISRLKLEAFLSQLDNNTLRLKGYVSTTSGEALIVQYVPGQIVIEPAEKAFVGGCELISIGYVVPPFKDLQD